MKKRLQSILEIVLRIHLPKLKSDILQILN